MSSAANASAAALCPHNGTAHDGTSVCHWVHNPVTRGTLNILWLCISTLGICVWSAVHPGIPYPGSSQLRCLRIRIGWLLVGLFMPEMLVICALGQLREAMNLLMAVEQAGVRCEIPWWMPFIKSWELQNVNSTIKTPFWIEALPHSLHPSLPRARVLSGQSNHAGASTKVPYWERLLESFMRRRSNTAGSNVGTKRRHPRMLQNSKAESTETVEMALVRQPSQSSTSGVQSRPASLVQAPPAQARVHPWTLRHSFYAVMGGYFAGTGGYYAGCSVGNRQQLAEDYDNARSEIVQWVQNPLHHQDGMSIPDVSAANLADRSKANDLSKSLLIWQLFVFLANCAARWNQALPLSLLEISTISHSLCSLITLLIWWYKPKSIEEVNIIGQATALGSPPALTLRRGLGIASPGHEAIDGLRTVAIIAVAVLYGLPHLLGLSVHFPSSAERALWKLATSGVIALPLTVCFTMWIVKGAVKDREPAMVVRLMIDGPILLFLILYAVSSTFLVGESLRQVFALPEGSFHEPELARYLPTFS